MQETVAEGNWLLLKYEMREGRREGRAKLVF